MGPAGVGAMATGATNATLRDQAYGAIVSVMQLAGSTYYQESWTRCSLQMMTGLLQDLYGQRRSFLPRSGGRRGVRER